MLDVNGSQSLRNMLHITGSCKWALPCLGPQFVHLPAHFPLHPEHCCTPAHHPNHLESCMVDMSIERHGCREGQSAGARGLRLGIGCLQGWAYQVPYMPLGCCFVTNSTAALQHDTLVAVINANVPSLAPIPIGVQVRQYLPPVQRMYCASCLSICQPS